MKIGVILQNLIPSQLSFEVINLINANSKIHQYTVFYEDIMPNLNSISCPVMNISELKYFRSGRLVSLNMSGASYLLKSVSHIEPLLYMYDLEWLRGKTDYVSNLKIMRSVPLLTRSVEYSKLVANYTNSPCPFIKLEEIICPRMKE